MWSGSFLNECLIKDESIAEFSCLADQVALGSSSGKFLGSVEASVVGLSHLFHNAADSNGVQLKKLASFLRKSCVNANGLLEIVLIRNKNLPADANAVSILVPNPNDLSKEGKDHFVWFGNRLFL